MIKIKKFEELAAFSSILYEGLYKAKASIMAYDSLNNYFVDVSVDLRAKNIQIKQLYSSKIDEIYNFNKEEEGVQYLIDYLNRTDELYDVQHLPLEYTISGFLIKDFSKNMIGIDTLMESMRRSLDDKIINNRFLIKEFNLFLNKASGYDKNDLNKAEFIEYLFKDCNTIYRIAYEYLGNNVAKKDYIAQEFNKISLKSIYDSPEYTKDIYGEGTLKSLAICAMTYIDYCKYPPMINEARAVYDYLGVHIYNRNRRRILSIGCSSGDTTLLNDFAPNFLKLWNKITDEQNYEYNYFRDILKNETLDDLLKIMKDMGERL